MRLDPLIEALTAGTARQGTRPPLPSPLAEAMLEAPDASPSLRLLYAAGVRALEHTIGRLPSSELPLPAPAELDPRPPCRPRAAALVQQLLSGSHDGLLPEALERIHAAGQRLPHALLPLLFRAKGREKVIFVSDSMRATGLAPGRYRLGGAADGADVDVTPDAAILHGQNLYAGSIAPVSKMVADAVQKSGIPLIDAVLAATRNPAALLNLTDRGDIAAGCRDAINLISPDGTLERTIVSGRVFEKGVETT